MGKLTGLRIGRFVPKNGKGRRVRGTKERLKPNGFLIAMERSGEDGLMIVYAYHPKTTRRYGFFAAVEASEFEAIPDNKLESYAINKAHALERLETWMADWIVKVRKS